MRDYGIPCRLVRLKGLHTPRLLIFFSGWLHARKGFIKIDEWGCMQSGFIKRKQEDFEYYSAKLMENMEEALAPSRVELRKLLMEYTSLKQKGAPSRVAQNKAAKSIREIRAAESGKREDKQRESRRRELFGEIVRVQKELDTKEVIMEEELLAAAARLRALLSCYCHGVLYHWGRREWDAKAVPEVSIDNRAYQLYRDWHKEDNDYVKEVIRYGGKTE